MLSFISGPSKIQGQEETRSASQQTLPLSGLSQQVSMLVFSTAKSQWNSTISRLWQSDYMDKFRAVNTPNPSHKFHSQNYQ